MAHMFGLPGPFDGPHICTLITVIRLTVYGLLLLWKWRQTSWRGGGGGGGTDPCRPCS